MRHSNVVIYSYVLIWCLMQSFQPVQSQEKECPEEFNDLTIDDKCYKFVEQSKTFWDAKHHCEETLSGKLVEPDNDQIWGRFMTALSESGYPAPVIWVGVMRRIDCERWVFAKPGESADEGDLEYEDVKDSIDTPFENFVFLRDKKEDCSKFPDFCGALQLATEDINAVRCNSIFAFICETNKITAED